MLLGVIEKNGECKREEGIEGNMLMHWACKLEHVENC